MVIPLVFKCSSIYLPKSHLFPAYKNTFLEDSFYLVNQLGFIGLIL
jgi:hypothetical protein